MALHRLGLVSLIATALAAPGALAQDDDLLSPLTPSEAAPPKRVRSRKKVKPPPPVDDDALAPLAAPSELLITVQDNVKGARLFIDEKDAGLITGQPVEVPPGEHKVSIKRLGFADLNLSIRVANGEREELDITLEPVAGVLTIQANVPGADVMIDGKALGKAPLREIVLSPGTHEVRVEKSGYLPEVSKLSIRPGKDYTLNSLLQPGNAVASADRPERGRLEPVGTSLGPSPLGGARPAAVSAEPAWYGRWYVWAGAAAVVAAAAGGTVVALNSASPLSEEQICGAAGCDGTINFQTIMVRVGGGRF